MARISLDLKFEGYAFFNNENIPEAPGIYCIYEMKFTSDCKRESVELIYIGQAQRGKDGNLKTRIQNHGRTDYINRARNVGGKRVPKVLYAYSYADMSDYSTHEIDVAEAALIFKMQPAGNKNLKDVYNQDDVCVSLSGKIRDLPDKPFNLDQGTTYDDYFGINDLLRWLDDFEDIFRE